MDQRTTPGSRPSARHAWRGYAGAALLVGVSTAAAALMQPAFELSNLAMVYLVGVVATAVGFGMRPAILSAVLSVVLFDFCFVPPRFTLRVTDTQYLVTFGVMLLVAIVIGTLAARLREQLEEARQRERRTAALYRLSHGLASLGSTQDLLTAAIQQVEAVFDCRVAVLLPDPGGRLDVVAGDASLFGVGEEEREVAQWSFDHDRPAGLEAAHPPASGAIHLPLLAIVDPLGVIAVRPNEPERMRDPDRLQLLRTFANQIALALERSQLAEAAGRARTQAESERTRSALLSSVSHDLRTPLAVITGAASSLRDDPGVLSAARRRELAETVAEEAQRLNRLIGQLLDMTRLESGSLRARKEWHSLEEVVGAALARLEPRLGDRPVRVAIPPDLPLVPLDAVLFEQLISNLVENAHKYSPGAQAIEISARVADSMLRFEVADHGPGLPEGEEQRLFERFYRGPGPAGRPGVGLGLAICRGIVEAHGGAIAAANRPGGGALFTVTLPIEGEPPVVEREPGERDAAPLA